MENNESINDNSARDMRLCVLIDADNAPRTAMKDVMAEIAVYGSPTIKRIYGDWTTPPAGLLEKHTAGKCHNPHTAVQLHHRQELHRLRHDNRRHGHSLFPPCRRLCPGFQRQRFYPACHASAGGGHEGIRNRRKKKTPAPLL